ncbi:MAG: hypothetical protein ACE5JG_08620 [Planctomycetota bacterium]
MKPLGACRHLCNKAWLFPPPVEGEADFNPEATPSWCEETHDAIGPDGGDVREDCCTRDRPCFRPRVEL